jgi:hypothetical protein
LKISLLRSHGSLLAIAGVSLLISLIVPMAARTQGN